MDEHILYYSALLEKSLIEGPLFLSICLAKFGGFMAKVSIFILTFLASGKTYPYLYRGMGSNYLEPVRNDFFHR